MMEAKRYLQSVLNTDLSQDVLFVAGEAGAPALDGEDVTFAVSLVRKRPLPGGLYFDQDEPAERKLFFRLRFYSGGMLRMLVATQPRPFVEESPMLEWSPDLKIIPAQWCRLQANGALAHQRARRSSTLRAAVAFNQPCHRMARMRFQANDHFVPNLWDSFPLILLERAGQSAWLGLSLHIPPGEHFYGRLQWLVADDSLDLFVIGGGMPARIVENYRKITGFPQLPPAWSFGMWMSRSSYASAAQASQVAHRLREEGYPSDVLNLDVGWFREDWRCDWQFSPEKYPDPAGFLKQLDEDGFQVSLWQSPYIHPELPLAQAALETGFVGRETNDPISHRHWLGYTLDLTRPEAVAWYQSLLAPLLEMGAAVIKTDFGEEVDEGANYAGLPGEKYHNLFALLYTKAAWDLTERVRGKGEGIIGILSFAFVAPGAKRID